MKDLGDDMEGATGWHSERGYETLGDITGRDRGLELLLPGLLRLHARGPRA